MALMTFERDYDEARNEYFGLTDDPSKVVKDIGPDKGHLSVQEAYDICEVVCDNLCMWPSEYKDPDDLRREKCKNCPLMEKLGEFEDE